MQVMRRHRSATDASERDGRRVKGGVARSKRAFAFPLAVFPPHRREEGRGEERLTSMDFLCQLCRCLVGQYKDKI